MRSVAPRSMKTGDNHRMQSSTRYLLSLPPSLDLFLRLALFADWISAQFSLTLDLLSLQSPLPTCPPQSQHCCLILISSPIGFESQTQFLYFGGKKSVLCSFLGLSGGVEWCDRFTHLCHSDEYHGPCLPVCLATELPNAFGVFLLLYPPSICSQLPREDSSDAGLKAS